MSQLDGVGDCTSHKHAIADLVVWHVNFEEKDQMVVKETMIEGMEGNVTERGVNQLESFSVVGLHGKLHDGHPQHRGALWWSSLCSEVHKSKVRPIHATFHLVSLQNAICKLSDSASLEATVDPRLPSPSSLRTRRPPDAASRGRKRWNSFISACPLPCLDCSFAGRVLEHGGGSAPPCHPEER